MAFFGRAWEGPQSTSKSHSSTDRGRHAVDPGDIPPSGWKDVLSRVKRRAIDNNLSITAAGVAFYALIATFPGLLALSGLYGLVFDRGEMGEQFSFLQAQLQPEATYLLVALLQGLAEADRSRLGFGIAGGVLVTLWGSSLGIRALIRALNVAYGEKEKAPTRHGLAGRQRTGP